MFEPEEYQDIIDALLFASGGNMSASFSSEDNKRFIAIADMIRKSTGNSPSSRIEMDTCTAQEDEISKLIREVFPEV